MGQQKMYFCNYHAYDKNSMKKGEKVHIHNFREREIFPILLYILRQLYRCQNVS